RCRQNWIDAIAGKQPPLLQLLEVSPVVEVESVQEAIEHQALDAAKTSPGAQIDPVQEPPLESKFSRIVYPRPTAKIEPKMSQSAIVFLRDIGHKVDRNTKPPQALTEQRPPGRGDGRGGDLELAVGMLVGRRRDRLHLGKILAIYKSRRGIWRAKVQPLNKPNFVYFDCANLIEQKLLYDYEMKPGGFIPIGTIFDKARGENFEVYSRKVRSAKPTIWTPGQLSQLSIFRLKQIAREMEIPSIPGSAGKRSLIRAILAEQAISQEKAAAQRENSSPIAQKQKSAPIASKKRAAASPLGNQLSLFDVAV
ncbi:hypothetical protein QUB26_30770, partial [Microcoleus sp. B4-C1]